MTRISRKGMTGEELQRFFGAIDNLRDKLAFKLCYTYACRIGELVRIKLSDIQSDTIVIQGLKNGKKQTYPLSSELKEMLSEWMKIRPKRGEFLFPTEQNNGNHVSKVRMQKWFYKYCEMAGVPRFSSHSLRYTRALDLVSRDAVNPFEVQNFMRHRTIGMILHYIQEKQFDFGKYVE